MGAYDMYRTQTEFNVPDTMTAVVMSGTGFENVTTTEVPIPRPGPDQLLARVDAAGVCTSILKLIAQGSDHTFLNGWDPAAHPLILGDEGSVTVVQVGENLRDQYAPGQRFGIQPAVDVGPICHRERYRDNAANMRKVAVGYTLPGNLAQYMLVQEEVLQGKCLLPLPDDNLPYFAVSMGEPISCVYSAQERQYHIHKASPNDPREPKLGLLPGGTAVVIGAGAMGRMHMEMAMRFRPANLIACDVIEDRLQLVRDNLGPKADTLGVNLVAVHSDKLEQTVRELSKGHMADDIILAVGIKPVQQNALTLLGKGGVANLFGGLPKGQHMLEINAIAVHYDEIKVVGSSGGEPSDLAATLKAIADGDIDPGNYVYGIGDLAHVPRVLEMIKNNEVDGKVIVYPHARTSELAEVDGWNIDKEKQFLDTHLAQ